MKTIRVIRGAG